MFDMIKIAVDAMGGDNSPKKIIDGIILNHSKNKNNFFKIFGDQNKIDPLINRKISKMKKIRKFYKKFMIIFLDN